MPYTPAEFAEEAAKAYKAGAAMVHVHAKTDCGVAKDEFPAIMQSALMGGHMRVGLEDNTRLAGGELAKGNYELVEQAVKIAEVLGRTRPRRTRPGPSWDCEG